MSSNFNNKSNNNSNNTYISDLNSLSSDNFLNEVSPEDLRELSLWENAKFNNFDSNPIDIKSLDANFEDREVPVALSPSNVLVRHDFISLANQYHPIYAYPTATPLQPIIINPPVTAATYPHIFSAPSITPVAITRNLMDLTKADNSDNSGSSNDKNSNSNDNDNDNNKNNGSKNISKKSSQETSNISSTKVISNDPQNQSIDQSTKTDNDSEQISPEEAARLAAEEDKRRRNTAASARFRVKKKLREQALERTAKDMTAKVEMLEARVKELEMENKWLRDLIVEKDARMLDIEPVGKRSGDCGGNDDDNNNNMILTEQDCKKPKIEKSPKKEIIDQANKKIKLKN